MSDGPSARRRSKVGRLLHEYDMSVTGEDLERKWTDEGQDRWSLRDLARWFNEQILLSALRENDRQPVEESIATTYEILTDPEANPGSKSRTRRDLERAGIDVDGLCDDFVSHQAIHTYLTEYRDASPPEGGASSGVETSRRAIDRLRGKTATVAESNLDRLAGAGEVTLGDVDVFVDVTVYCDECGYSASFGEFVSDGGCEC